MSTTLRGGRLDRPEMPTGEIVLQAPPQLEQHEGAGGVMMNAIPMLGSLGSIVLVASIGGAAGGGRSYLAAGMFLFATVGFIVVQIDRQRKLRTQQVTGSRTEYLRYLANVRKVAREAADQQRRALTWQHPAPSALPSLAEERSRIWEHHTSDAEFLHVRYGLCAQPLALDLVAPETAVVDQVDPAAASALHRLLVVHRLLPNLPASIDLRAFDRIELCGPEEAARALARAMICSAAAFQSPDDLEIAVLASDDHLAHWDWMKWLPHAQSTQQSDAVGPMRMVSTSLNDLAALLPPDLSERPRFGADERPATPHLLFVVDGGFLPPGNHVVPPDGLHGVTVLDLPARWDEMDDASCLRLLFEADRPAEEGRLPLTALRLREPPVRALADQCDQATAEAFARRLTPLHTVTTGGEAAGGEISAPMDLMDLLGLGDVHSFDPATAWRQRPARDRLRVPIGLGDGGSVIYLDIKESAQQGMGPHGLVIGATGSGKSEFLRTLVLGLAMTHSPEQLNMVLVDFKGGATFAGMSEMPHVSAVITNLAQELTLVDRMQDALSGEMVRRQELLREAGNYASVRDYEKARAAGEPLEPLPSLFIVVDEFSEMLTAKPEFIDLFVAIGRLGRSLGLHLLLASQRLEEGRLRGLESHLSYRVGLRTFSAAESRGVLGVPDAYELPARAGPRVPQARPVDAAAVQGGVRLGSADLPGPGAPRGGRAAARHPAVHDLRGADPRPVGRGRPRAGARGGAAAAGRAGLDARRRRRPDGGARPGGAPGVAAAARRARHPRRPDERPRRGPRPRARLAAVAQVRRAGGAARHRRPAARAAPRHPDGQPRRRRRARRRGRRSAQRQEHRCCAPSSRAWRWPPRPGSRSSTSWTSAAAAFSPLTALPHVAGVGSRSEPDVVRRIVAEVTGIVDRREAYFRSQGIDSIETYRSRRARDGDQGRVDDGYGDVYLVVDGWSTLRADFDDLELHLQQLAGRGLTFGFHLLVASSRWADFRAAMRDTFGTRLELRLGDPLDSEVDRRVAALVPAGRPGRGLVSSKLHFLAALPRIDGDHDTDTLGDGVEDLVKRVAAAWRGPQGPKLRLLPERIELASLVAALPAGDQPGRLVLGVNEKDLAPVGLDPDTQPHLLIYGDGQSGKSAALRTYLREVARTRTPQEAQLVVVDYRRSLLGEVPEDYLLNYLTSATQTTPVVKDLAAYLESRIPGPDVTPDQLRTRSWWKGAEVYVVIDDYDLVVDPAVLAHRAAAAADGPVPRRRPAPGRRTAGRRRRPRVVRVGAPVHA